MEEKRCACVNIITNNLNDMYIYGTIIIIVIYNDVFIYTNLINYISFLPCEDQREEQLNNGQNKSCHSNIN